MARVKVDLFCEDSGHEQFASVLVKRLARESGIVLDLSTVSGRGGKARALGELKAYQRTIEDGSLGRTSPDLLVVIVDVNCTGWHEARSQVEASVSEEVFPSVVIGCPEPHVERWCMADPISFAQVVGTPPPADPGKCEKDLYKTLLRETILSAGHVILVNEMEFAPDLVEKMDFYRAGKSQPSLKHFVDDLSAALKRSESS